MTEKIPYSDFEKVDLRVAEILEVEDIAGKDRLYKLTIDLGEEEPRTILAGIKKYYEKEELVGKKIIVAANLEPRRLGGMISDGMLLAAGSKEEDTCVLLTTEKDIPVGARIS